MCLGQVACRRGKVVGTPAVTTAAVIMSTLYQFHRRQSIFTKSKQNLLKYQ
jgi:hypothetical protein